MSGLPEDVREKARAVVGPAVARWLGSEGDSEFACIAGADAAAEVAYAAGLAARPPAPPVGDGDEAAERVAAFVAHSDPGDDMPASFGAGYVPHHLTVADLRSLLADRERRAAGIAAVGELRAEHLAGQAPAVVRGCICGLCNAWRILAPLIGEYAPPAPGGEQR